MPFFKKIKMTKIGNIPLTKISKCNNLYKKDQERRIDDEGFLECGGHVVRLGYL